MVEPLPTFEQVLELMRSSKPPIACRVVELDGVTPRRTAAVLFDGLQGWYIDDGARAEVRSSNESALCDSGGKLQRVGPGVGGVHSNGWVKTPIEPRRMSLDRATGRVLRRDVIMNGQHSSSKPSACGKAKMSSSRCRLMLQRA
jgi:hypothetical protein